MSSKIYTKTGDAGYTTLLGGSKVSKSNPYIDAYGTVDELNSHIGLLCDCIPDSNAKAFLLSIQNNLFVVGSLLSRGSFTQIAMRLPVLEEDEVTKLETAIDEMNESLPPLTHFILPGGNQCVSFIHIARCVCRRAERSCAALQEHKIVIEPLILKYLNRLSDYLFVLARYVGKQTNAEEIIWKGR